MSAYEGSKMQEANEQRKRISDLQSKITNKVNAAVYPVREEAKQEIMDESRDRMSNDYAERVCSGQFPITYTREQVVAHTANDYKAGWNEANETCKRFWYNSGLSAERIIGNEEISRLRATIKELEKELEIKSSKIVALGNIIDEGFEKSKYGIEAENIQVRKLLYFLGDCMRDIKLVEGDVIKAIKIGSSIVLTFESGKKYKLTFSADVLEITIENAQKQVCRDCGSTDDVKKWDKVNLQCHKCYKDDKYFEDEYK